MSDVLLQQISDQLGQLVQVGSVCGGLLLAVLFALGFDRMLPR